MPWRNWQQGHRCPVCARKAKLSLSAIKKAFGEEGYVLLGNKYKNNQTKLSYTCPVGHKGNITWSSWQQGSRCPICSNGRVSPISQEWLDDKGIEDREVYLRDVGVRVDGYKPSAKIVYEFLGDYWHGNPDIYEMADVNKTTKKTFGALYKKTMDRIDELNTHGYTVVYIWENDYRQIKENGVRMVA
jgi:hypothetical protein